MIDDLTESAYFERVRDRAFTPTVLVGGAWEPTEQHIAPVLGLIVHEIDRDRVARGREDLVLARFTFDILGVLPLEEFEISVEVIRPGRTVELVDAVLTRHGRPAVRARVWLLATQSSAGVAGTPIPSMPPPGELEPWDPTTVWPGGFIASIEVRRDQRGPGDGDYWARTTHPLVAGETVSPVAAAAGLFDIANGMMVRARPQDVRFPNLDLTAHLFRTPEPGWLGFQTRVSFGPDGIGLTSTVLHDVNGPVGSVSQILTVRPSVRSGTTA